jgi:two-component sensor histidine kinase
MGFGAMRTILTGFFLLIIFSGNAQRGLRPGEIWINLKDDRLPVNDLAEYLFSADDGAIWVAYTHSGLFRFNGYAFLPVLPEPFGLQKSDLNRVISMENLPGGRIVLCARNEGVCILDMEEFRAGRLVPDDARVKLALQRVWDFFSDEEQNLWMATWKGLVEYRPGAGSYFYYEFPFETGRLDLVHPSVFRKIIPDPVHPDKFWIAGISGLFSFDRSSKQFTRHLHPMAFYRDGHRDFPDEHRQYMITDMVLAGTKLYLATWGGGVLSYDTLSGDWAQTLLHPYRTSKTLDENIVNRLVRVDSLLFFSGVPRSGWIGLEKPWPYFLPDRSMGMPIGMPGNGYALCRDRNHRLWISTYGEGIFRSAESMGEPVDSVPNTMELYQITVDGEPRWNLSGGKLSGGLILEADSDTVRFDFALVNPLDTAWVEYQYNLEGYTRGWTSGGSSPRLLLEGLPHGEYLLNVRAREGRADWRVCDPLRIERQVYFFQRTWFWIVSLVVLLGLAAWIVMAYLRKRLESERIEKQLVQLKMQALQAQMNPHFIFNSLNAIQNLILKEDSERAADQMTIFSRLVREILKNSEKKLVSLRDDLSMLEKYLQLENHRFTDKFRWTLDLEETLDPDRCFVPPLLVQPFVENAVWHGLMPLDRVGNLTIQYTRQEDFLVIRIEDDGVGRERATGSVSPGKQKNGLGIRIAGSRVDMLSKLLGVQTTVEISDVFPDKFDRGTRVLIRIPYIDHKIYLSIRD